MARYRVCVEGRNLLRRAAAATGAGGAAAQRRQGFVTIRIVEADGAEDAGELAMEEIWNDEAFRVSLQNDDDDPPLLYLSDVRRVSTSETLSAAERGYAFFEEQELDLATLLGEADDETSD